jgi:O-glycosyl hydrolase
MVAQLVNSRKADTEVGLEAGGRSLQVALPAISITTLQWQP